MNKQSMYSNNRIRSRYCVHQDRTFPELGSRTRGDPSFSSTLLDSIFNSIDHPFQQDLGTAKPSFQLGRYREESAAAMIKKQTTSGGKQRDRSLKRAIMIETWMEKQSSSSSESSSGGGSTLFSSSETESCYRDKLCSKAPRPRPLRSDNRDRDSQKSSDGFTKKKQPISPGRRISIFLNSIFSSGNGRRKAKMCSIGAVEDVNLDCRSKTLPFSRSCMTETGKTGRKFKNGAHKTVRFYPVSIIVDEYSRSCGSVDDPSLIQAQREVEIEKQSFNGGSAGEFSKMSIDQNVKGACESDEEDQNDDANSCASSELFELDHLIGKAERFREELPVYETTSLEINKAIANGFIF